MIRQSTILAMTPIAMELSNKNIDLSDKVGDIIKGLNDVSAGVAAMTEDNVAVNLPEAADDGDHSMIQAEVNARLAAVIRASMGVISNCVKPILKDADRLISNCIGEGGALDAALSQIRIDMTNMEPAFLASGMCPSEVPASFAQNPTINVNNIIKGNWPRIEDAHEVYKLIDVDVDVINPFLTDPDEIKKVYNDFFADKYYWTIFESRVREGDVVNVLNPHHYKFSSFRSMVILSLLVNKFRSMDDPFDGVMGVSLEDYRANLNFLRDLTNTVLARFRFVWLDRAKAGLVIIDEDVKVAPATFGPLEGIETVQGTIRIGYNNSMLEVFANKEEESIIDYALGYAYAKYRGYKVRDVITDGDVVVSAYKEYIHGISAAMTVNADKQGREAFLTACRNFSTDEKNKGYLEVIKSDVPLSNRIAVAVNSRINLEGFFTEYLVNGIARGERSTMGTALAVELAEIFGSPIAAEILKNNMGGTPASIEQQRKILTGSIVAAILKRLV
ncbi:virion structural protein [Aeromonas phage D3]|uniref:Uncharacterized protein n=1 Tax=Aeromonas phage D3 TaxID=2593327 RepID=A0A514TVA8_9CAUD|nr:virion structural protein [Aeromonas phage D3]QDJ96968.1 hypothetical protein D3_0238 [Aeromonas phage D3]